MSQRPPKPVPEDEEEEEEEMDFGEDEEDGVDLLGALESWFTTEEGETVATALVGLKTAVEMQNKILVKMLSALSKVQPCKCPSKEEAESA